VYGGDEIRGKEDDEVFKGLSLNHPAENRLLSIL
jgi:hypothetical protein